MKIEYKDINDLIPYVNNTRTHSEEQINQIASSIKEFGFTNPVLIDKNNGLIAGHGRVMGAKKLGLKEVPTITLDNLTEAQKKAYIIADNKIALNAGWNEELLKIEIEALQEMDFDIDLLGFDGDELKDILDIEVDSDWDNDAKNEFNLKDRFLVPPFSVLRGDLGGWQDRKREWTNIGINSGGGRSAGLQKSMNSLSRKVQGDNAMTESDESIFDPFLAEILYSWFNIKNGSILDPFCGGSVRGIVAEKLGYKYTGFDIRKEQITYNEQNALECGVTPKYIHSDSNRLNNYIENETVDMVFSCPPYADLEVYSDLQDDLSNMEYNEFINIYRQIIEKTYKALKNNRFACFVVGEVRSKNGDYYNFVGDTIKAFIDAGYKYYNEIILVNSAGTASLRAGRYMKNRKIAKTHQNVLVFYKGEMKEISNEFDELSDKYIDFITD